MMRDPYHIKEIMDKIMQFDVILNEIKEEVS